MNSRRMAGRVAGRQLAMSAVVGVAVLSLAACGGSSSSDASPSSAEAAASSAVADSEAPSPSAVPESASADGGGTSVELLSPADIELPPAPAPDALAGKTIGIINFASQPFVDATNEGVKKEVEAAGGTTVFCELKSGEDSIKCERNLASRGVDGVVAFNPNPDGQSLCDAGPQVPHIAVYLPFAGDCSPTYVSNDRQQTGTLGGLALADVAKNKFNCDITAYVSLESPNAGEPVRMLMQAYQDAFESVCGPIPADKYRRAPETSSIDSANEYMRNVLQAFPVGNAIFVAGTNDQGCSGVLAAAESLDRASDVYCVGQGADNDYRSRAANPQFIGSIAYFPEYYGNLAVPALIEALKGNGDSLPEVTNGPIALLTAQNVNEFYPGTIQ